MDTVLLEGVFGSLRDLLLVLFRLIRILDIILWGLLDLLSHLDGTLFFSLVYLYI